MGAIAKLEAEGNVRVYFESGMFNWKTKTALTISIALATIAISGAIFILISPNQAPTFLQNIGRTWVWVGMGIGGSVLLASSAFFAHRMHKRIIFINKTEKYINSMHNDLLELCKGELFKKLKSEEDSWGRRKDVKPLGQYSTHGAPKVCYSYIVNNVNTLAFVDKKYEKSFESWLTKNRSWTQT